MRWSDAMIRANHRASSNALNHVSGVPAACSYWRRALELAEQNDLYVMLTIFSFDNFRATRMESSLKVRGITPIVMDDAKRRALMDTVVAPLARAVEASSHAKRMVAWDMINEVHSLRPATRIVRSPTIEPGLEHVHV